MQNSQKRIIFDDYARSVNDDRNFVNYQSALSNIVGRNAMSRSIIRRRNEEIKEREILEKIQKVEEESKRKELEEIQKAKSAQVEAQKAREIFNEKKFRQQIRENSQELRELESKLRTAYVSKALAAQRKEKEAIDLAETLQKQKESEEIEKLRLEHLKELECNEIRKKERMKRHHEELTEQIVTAHRKHQKLYEDFLKDKFYLDEIAKLVAAEIANETIEKLERKATTRKEMEAFEIIKKEMQRAHDILIEEENLRIRKYCEEREMKMKIDEQRSQELEKNRQDLNMKMKEELEEIEDKKLQRENLLQELWAFEQNEKNEEKIRKQIEYRFRVRVETKLALENQLREQEERRTDEAQQDKNFRENQIKMWAERDKLEQMSDEKRRRKMVEYRKAIKEILEERKAQRTEKMSEEIRLRDIEKESEKRKQEIVEEERIKIIQEHANALLGYLPPGVLRKEDKIFFPISS